MHYYQFVGRTDILLHTYYVDSLVQLGHVTGIFYDYQPFPLWHIMNAGIYLAGGAQFPTYKVMAIAGGLAFLLLPLAVYLIAMKLFKDERVALVAALITIFFPDLIIMGTSTIPRVVAEILIVFLIFVLLTGKSRSGYLLIVPVMAAIVMYHSISILFAAVILLALYVMQVLFVKKEERFVSIWHVALAVAMTAVYWTLNAGMLVQRLMNNAAASTDTISAPRVISQNMPWNELFNYLQYLPAILFILVGVFLLMLAKNYGNRAKIFGLAALGLVWLSFPGPLQALGSLAQNLGLDRIAEYAFPFLILIAAAGIAGLFFRSGKYGRAALVVIFCVWAVLAVSNDWVASDNPMVKRPFYTYYFTEQEVTGMDNLVTHATGVLESDYVANRYYEGSVKEAYTTILEVDVPNMTFVRHGPEDVLLVREGEHDKRELRVAALDNSKFISKPEGGSFVYVDRNKDVWATLAGYNRIYDSAAIQAYS
jgi:hypothetical protein